MNRWRLHGYPGSPGWLRGEHQPDIRPIGRRKYVCMAPYGVTITDNNSVRWVTVPRGFELNGADVPRWTWSVSGLLPDGLIRAAACIHDYLYNKRGRVHNLNLTRAECDLIFKELMIAAGMTRLRASVAHAAVRSFGGHWWRKV